MREESFHSWIIPQGLSPPQSTRTHPPLRGGWRMGDGVAEGTAEPGIGAAAVGPSPQGPGGSGRTPIATAGGSVRAGRPLLPGRGLEAALRRDLPGVRVPRGPVLARPHRGLPVPVLRDRGGGRHPRRPDRTGAGRLPGRAGSPSKRAVVGVRRGRDGGGDTPPESAGALPAARGDPAAVEDRAGRWDSAGAGAGRVERARCAGTGSAPASFRPRSEWIRPRSGWIRPRSGGIRLGAEWVRPGPAPFRTRQESV